MTACFAFLQLIKNRLKDIETKPLEDGETIKVGDDSVFCVFSVGIKGDLKNNFETKPSEDGETIKIIDDSIILHFFGSRKMMIFENNIVAVQKLCNAFRGRRGWTAVRRNVKEGGVF